MTCNLGRMVICLESCGTKNNPGTGKMPNIHYILVVKGRDATLTRAFKILSDCVELEPSFIFF